MFKRSFTFLCIYKSKMWKLSNVVFQASLNAKQLIFRLLHRDPKNRLGSREGASEIKRHPFFRGVNWALVRCMVNSKLNLKRRLTEKLHFLTYLIILQNPPELEAPLFQTTDGEKDANKASDFDPKELELSVFWS